VCIALCAIVAHNIAQTRPDNFPSYPPDNHHRTDDVYLTEGGGLHYVVLHRYGQRDVNTCVRQSSLSMLRTSDKIDATVAAPDEGGVHVGRRPGKTTANPSPRQTVYFRTRHGVRHAPIFSALSKAVIITLVVYLILMANFGCKLTSTK